jgi:hypothetical protein
MKRKHRTHRDELALVGKMRRRNRKKLEFVLRRLFGVSLAARKRVRI